MTLSDYLDLADELTEMDAQGRMPVPFLDSAVLMAHAQQRNRERRAQAETQRFVRRDRVVAHA